VAILNRLSIGNALDFDLVFSKVVYFQEY